jgi:hypothetical protein
MFCCPCFVVHFQFDVALAWQICNIMMLLLTANEKRQKPLISTENCSCRAGGAETHGCTPVALFYVLTGPTVQSLALPEKTPMCGPYVRAGQLAQVRCVGPKRPFESVTVS